MTPSTPTALDRRLRMLESRHAPIFGPEFRPDWLTAADLTEVHAAFDGVSLDDLCEMPACQLAHAGTLIFRAHGRTHEWTATAADLARDCECPSCVDIQEAPS